MNPLAGLPCEWREVCLVFYYEKNRRKEEMAMMETLNTDSTS
jgi:hypothetical protein